MESQLLCTLSVPKAQYFQSRALLTTTRSIRRHVISLPIAAAPQLALLRALLKGGAVILFPCTGLKGVATTQNARRCLSPSVPHKVHSVTLATKAEEYDLIVAEAGLVRIEGYVLLLQLSPPAEPECCILYSGTMRQASL